MPILNKPKPCKGTGKAKGYGCGSLELKRTYGLGYNCGCYSKWLLNTKEGKEKIKRATLKATKNRRELEQGIKQKKERQSLSYLKTNVTAIVHQYIRARDKGKSCISCGIPYKSNFDAGHYFKAELYSSLKYHSDNIHGQCIRCNRPKDGNLSQYQINLPKRIGQDKYDELVKLADQEKKLNFKWDREELKKIKDKFKLLLKELKNEDT